MGVVHIAAVALAAETAHAAVGNAQTATASATSATPPDDRAHVSAVAEPALIAAAVDLAGPRRDSDRAGRTGAVRHAGATLAREAWAVTAVDDPMLVTLRASDLVQLLEGVVRDALAARQPSRPEVSPLVSRREAARALGISLAALDRLARAGLPRVMVGAVPRYDLQQARRWLADRGTP